MAAYTRTYVDKEEWRTRPGVLGLSLLCFAVGPVCLVIDRATASDTAFTGFLAVGVLYGFYHVVRQHYGFLALYKSKSQDRADFKLDRWFLYFGAWAPYLWFTFAHPATRRVMRMDVTPSPVERALLLILAVGWGVAFLAWTTRALASPERRKHATKIAYVLVAVGPLRFHLFPARAARAALRQVERARSRTSS